MPNLQSKKLNLFLILILALFFSSCLSQNSSKNSNATKNSNTISQTPTPISVPTNSPIKKIIIDIPDLANKSLVEIEKKYGKPTHIEEKDVYLGKKGEFRHYKIRELEFPLQIDYYKRKSVGFYIDLPESLYMDDPETVAQMFGFEVTKEEGNSTDKTTWWKKSFNGISFSSIHVRKGLSTNKYIFISATVEDLEK